MEKSTLFSGEGFLSEREAVGDDVPQRNAGHQMSSSVGGGTGVNSFY